MSHVLANIALALMKGKQRTFVVVQARTELRNYWKTNMGERKKKYERVNSQD